MVPAQAIHHILEFVFDLEFDVGGFEVNTQLREVGHQDGANDAVRAVHQQVAAIAGEAK